jgi:hypothetical protein
MPGGSYANLMLLGSLIFLHFSLFPNGMTYQIESLRLGEESRIKTSHMSAIIVGAVLLGMVVASHAHITTANEFGAIGLEGGTTEGGYHVAIAREQYDLPPIACCCCPTYSC